MDTQRPAARQLHARINAQDGPRFGVVCSAGRFWVKVAFSCLVQPAVGDRVLISLEDGGEGYVLGILERELKQPMRVRLEGDVDLDVPAGALTVRCRDGFSLGAGPRLVVQADQGTLSCKQADLLLGQLKVSGECTSSHWLVREERTARLDQQAAIVEARYGESRQSVSGLEQRHSGALHQQVSEDYRLKAQRMDLNAEGRLAIDGSTIELG